VVTANPLKLFLESNYENNRVWVSFRMEYNNTNNAIVTVLFNSFDQVREGLQAPSGTNR
jgi:predicted DNA-binding protein (MmcQ/YjbR family)